MADSYVIAGTQPGAYSRSHTTASGPWPSSGRSHVTLIAGAADSPSTIVWPRGSCDCHPGGGACPSIAGDRQLTVSRPAGRAVLAGVIRAGVRVLGAAWSLIAGDGQSTSRRPVAARLPLYSTGRRRMASLVSGCRCCTLARRLLLLASTVPGPAAGSNSAQSAAPPRLHCARARGRVELGPVGLSTPPPLCPGPRPGRTRLGPYTTPAGGRTPAGSRHRRGSHPSRQTPSDRQVRGTDSDTSWRRRGRRPRTAPLARGTCGPGPDDSAW